jgi:hypothetical protein
MLEDPAINFENPDDDAHAGQLDESGNWDSDDGNSDIDGASERAPSTNSPRQYLVTLTNTTATAQDARLLNQRTIQRLYQRLCFLSVQGSEGLKYDTLPLISPEPLVPNIMISEEVLQNKTVRDHLARIFKRVLPGKIRLPTRTNDAAKLLTAVEAQLNAFLGSSEQDDKLTLVLTTAQLSEQENGTVHIIPAKLRLLNAAAHTVLSGAYEPNDDRFEVFPVSYDVLKSLTVAAVASMKELRKEGLPVQMWRLGQELSTRGFDVYDQLLLQLNTFANDFAPGNDDDSALHDRAFRYIESACLRASVSAPRKNGTTLELRLKEP